MNRRVVGAVVFLFVVVPGLVLFGGVYSELVLSDESDSDLPTTNDADETVTPGSESQYEFVIEEIEECGTTCRDVSVRLTNWASEPRENVTITTVAYADGRVMWQGNETLDRIDAGETYTDTRRVNIEIWDALRIKGNDGYVTVVTEIESAEGTVRVEERRKVAKAWTRPRSNETVQSSLVPQSGHSSSITVTEASHLGQKSR